MCVNEGRRVCTIRGHQQLFLSGSSPLVISRHAETSALQAAEVTPALSPGTGREFSTATVAALMRLPHIFQPLRISNFSRCSITTIHSLYGHHQNQGGVVDCDRPCCKTFDHHTNSLVSQKASLWSPPDVQSALGSPLHFNCCHADRLTTSGPFLLAVFGFPPQSAAHEQSILALFTEGSFPATTITACTFFRFPLFKAAVTAQTKITASCQEAQSCIKLNSP